MVDTSDKLNAFLIRAADGCETVIGTYNEDNPYWAYFNGLWLGMHLAVLARSGDEMALKVLTCLSQGDVHLDEMTDLITELHKRLKEMP